MPNIATTRTLRKIIHILENHKEPIVISRITIESTGNTQQNRKYKDGLLFLISLNVVEKIKIQNSDATHYKLKEGFVI